MKSKKKNTASGTDVIQKNIETILKLEQESQKKLTLIEHVANNVTNYAGSTPFIILHICWFSIWILVNTDAIPGLKPFDPFPFSFLTLVVSLEAIFLTLLVLMSQNRMTREADKRAHLDLQINLLDEQETTVILRMVQKITKHLGLDDEIDEALEDLKDATDIDNLAKAIEEKSNPK